jgi:glycosyltransferase involved in cell wall biosynthesis
MVQPGSIRRNVVVTAARAVPEKNIELFWEVARACPNYEFVLLMTQDPRFVEYSLTIQRTAPVNARVILNPYRRIYQETLGKSRIYLHLMRGEHFGITVVEAMSAGCVPVAHDSGGPREIIGSSGFLWRTKEEIPGILKAADSSYDSLSKKSMIRARIFCRERFDEALAEVLEGIASRFP